MVSFILLIACTTSDVAVRWLSSSVHKTIQKDICPDKSCLYYTEEEFKSKLSRNNYNFSLIHMNIRSFDRYFKELYCMLNCLDLEFDIIGLTKVGTINVENRPAFLNEKYHFKFELPVDNLFGGVGLFINRKYDISERANLKINRTRDMEIEYIWYEVSQLDCKKLVIGVIYRHPGTRNYISKFISEMDTKLGLLSRGVKCVLRGDLNIDGLKINIHDPTTTFLNSIMTHNFIPTMTLPTRVTDNSITLIDHILLKTTTKYINDTIVMGNIYSDITDHLLNFLLIYNKTSNTNSKTSLRPLVRIFGSKKTRKNSTICSLMKFGTIFMTFIIQKRLYNFFIINMTMTMKHDFH